MSAYYVVARLDNGKTYYAAAPAVWADDIEQALQFHRERDAEKLKRNCSAPRDTFVLKVE